MTTEVGFVLPDGVAEKLVHIDGVEGVLAGIVEFMDGKLSDDAVIGLFGKLTRRVQLPGYEAMQHGRSIWSRPDERE